MPISGPSTRSSRPAGGRRWEGQPELPRLIRLRVRFAENDERRWPELIVQPHGRSARRRSGSRDGPSACSIGRRARRVAASGQHRGRGGVPSRRRGAAIPAITRGSAGGSSIRLLTLRSKVARLNNRCALRAITWRSARVHSRRRGRVGDGEGLGDLVAGQHRRSLGLVAAGARRPRAASHPQSWPPRAPELGADLRPSAVRGPVADGRGRARAGQRRHRCARSRPAFG